jgi:hypothetical protein
MFNDRQHSVQFDPSVQRRLDRDSGRTPISMMSAPADTSSSTCRSRSSKVRRTAPSENDSGLALTTPMTSVLSTTKRLSPARRTGGVVKGQDCVVDCDQPFTVKKIT